MLILFLIQKYQYIFSYHPFSIELLKKTYIHQTTQLERNLVQIENKITRYSHSRPLFSFYLPLVDFSVQLYIFDMKVGESFLFSKKGSSIRKQFLLITFLIQKYLHLFSYHTLNVGSLEMREIFQTTQLQRKLFEIKHELFIHHRTVFPLILVLRHLLVQLYIFDMIPCKSFLSSINGSLILKQLVLVIHFIQK